MEDEEQGSKPGGREIILKSVMKYRKKKLKTQFLISPKSPKNLYAGSEYDCENYLLKRKTSAYNAEERRNATIENENETSITVYYANAISRSTISLIENKDYSNLKEDVIDETYSKEELDKYRNKIFNQQKVMAIYRKKKYGKKRLMCRVKCTNCGRQKKLFLSNLVTNPEKYGSCICSDKNINARYDTINGLYKGTKKLKNNTSGYTGVSWVAKYGGEPYNK